MQEGGQEEVRGCAAKTERNPGQTQYFTAPMEDGEKAGVALVLREWWRWHTSDLWG
jgi:hypothetical protein